MRNEQHLASLHILEMIQRRPIAERVWLFADLLTLDHGFWQHPGAERQETLRGFAIRVARRALERSRSSTHLHFIDEEDISQDLLVAFLTEADTIRGNPRGWFVGVAVNMVYGMYRREHRARSIDDEVAEKRAAPTLERTPSSARLRQLRKSIKRLPSHSRQVVQGYMRGLSALEIAVDLGTSPEAVRQRMCRARHVLQTAVLERYHPKV